MHGKNKHIYKMMKQEMKSKIASKMPMEKHEDGTPSVHMRDESMEFKPEIVSEIRGEMPPGMKGEEMPHMGNTEGDTLKANYHNSFYPQYVNMKPDAYMARYTGDAVKWI